MDSAYDPSAYYALLERARRLEATVESLRRDCERLDFMDEAETAPNIHIEEGTDENDGVWGWAIGTDWYPTLRQAIDSQCNETDARTPEHEESK
jgi:hypothetical protein